MRNKISKHFFEDEAGPEEKEHVIDLLDKLTDQELWDLFNKVGINFLLKNGEKLNRENNEMVIFESDREDFYREYRKIIESRKKR